MRRRPRRTPWFQGRPCPACLRPPFRALDRCWHEDPPGTGTALAGALSLHLLSWVPWEALAGKECEQSAGVVSWHRTQAGAARCQSLVKTLARAPLPCPEFPPSGLACGLQPSLRQHGEEVASGSPQPGLPGGHTSSPPRSSPSRKDHDGAVW